MKKLLPLLLILLTSCAPGSGQGAGTDYSRIKVTQVIDGDTVRLADGRLLRYIGIDTPESKIKKGDQFYDSPQPFALKAAEFNRQMVENKSVRVEFDAEKIDVYDRLLGYCFIDDTLVNAKLLEEGLAVLYTRPPNVKYAGRLIAAQAKARRERKGLWGDYETIQAEEAGGHINQIRTVRGRVLDSYQSDKVILLNFGADYKTDFTVAIFKNSWDSFFKKGVNPGTYYRGKIVEVTGRIREYNGPEIIVNIPEEITVK